MDNEEHNSTDGKPYSDKRRNSYGRPGKDGNQPPRFDRTDSSRRFGHGEGKDNYKPRRRNEGYSSDAHYRHHDDSDSSGEFKLRGFDRSTERRSFRRDDGNGDDFKPRRFEHSAERRSFRRDGDGYSRQNDTRFGEHKRFEGKKDFRHDSKPNFTDEDPSLELENGEQRSSSYPELPRRSDRSGYRKPLDSWRKDYRPNERNSTYDTLLPKDKEAINDVAESFSSQTDGKLIEKPIEERPAPKPLPLPQNKKIALFGGSFDPIHNGHLMIAEYIIERGLADEILFIPSAIPPHKEGMTVATPEQRLEMVRLALADNEHFSYSDMELLREGKSYSFDTVSMLQKIYPDCLLYFIIGMDSLNQLHTWYRATELVQRVNFIVYPRPDVTPPAYIDLCASFGNRNALRLLQSVLPEHEKIVTRQPSEVAGEPDTQIVKEYNLPSSSLSSTEIRKAISQGLDVKEYLPELVLNYIIENHLYQQN